MDFHELQLVHKLEEVRYNYATYFCKKKRFSQSRLGGSRYMTVIIFFV